MADLTIISGVLPGRSRAGYCWPPRRQAQPRAVMLMPWPDEVSRPLESLGGTAVFDGLGSLRPSERARAIHRQRRMRQRMERAQSDESGQRCGRNSADTWL